VPTTATTAVRSEAEIASASRISATFELSNALKDEGTLTLKDTIVELGYTEDYDIEPLYNTTIYKKALDSILAEDSDEIYKSLEEHFNDYE
jgi:hypothetical protein